MDGKIDYKKHLFHMHCTRTHLLKDTHYNLYLFDDQIIISQDKESNNPKYIFPVNTQNRIVWQLVEKTRTIKSFGLKYKNEIRQFQGKNENLRELKKLLATRIMHRDISDFYIPVSYLGKGGSSKVYLVQDKDNKNEASYQLASKCIDKQYLMEDGGYDALFMEIKYMTQLEHRNIIKLYEIYEGENTFYMILEYLKGKSLHDVINRSHQDRLNFPKIIIILKQILEAVAYYHENDIIHRDLKPENIMFKEENNLNSLKIVDFGLATSTSVKEYPFPKCGTPGYVAPEVANLKDLKHKYDKICDIFSVGCIFYKLITLKDLFPGQDYEEILRLNKKCQINLANLAMYKTPQEALDLIKQMLNPNPNDRITAKQALKHIFFLNHPIHNANLPSNVKQSFQQKSKPQNYTADLGGTQDKDICFVQEINDECEIAEDENMNLPQVPVMKKKSFVMKADIRCNRQDPKPKAIKKYQTSDFEKSPQGQNGTHLTHNHPSLILKNSYQDLKMMESSSPYLAQSQHSSYSQSPGLISPSIAKSKFFEKNSKSKAQPQYSLLAPVNVIDEKEDEDSIHESNRKDSFQVDYSGKK